MKKKMFHQILKEEKGQSLFEFIMFVPLMLLMYSIALSLASSINGSINQQKITRGYFYSRVNNNSYLPTLAMLNAFNNVDQVSLAMIGWQERDLNETTPLAPCYQVKSLIKGNQQESCEETYNGPTQLIRVMTAYGLCGATFRGVATKEFYQVYQDSNGVSCTNQ